MSTLAQGSQERLDLRPATVAGLGAAIAITQDVATQGCRHATGSRAEALARVGQHLRAAAETLAASAGAAPGGAPPTQAHIPPQQPVSGTHVAQLCNDCIALAVQVLGNEDEPLTPFDVLAVTRAVTALCAARACAQEVAR